MSTQYFKKNPLADLLNSTLVTLPAPLNISLLWNFGSLLSMCLIFQIITGVILASLFTPSFELSFEAISFMTINLDNSWFIRCLHSNAASLFFMCLYVHTGRGLYYGSFTFKKTWYVGVTLLLLVMAAAFMGYVLPMNQMSFWGASVITNLFTEVPYIGPYLIQFIWGAVYISGPTIARFFSFHYLIPFVIMALVVAHITFLHQTGSSNPLGLPSPGNKLIFQPYLASKDVMGVTLTLLFFFFMCSYYPLSLGDNENFTPADPYVTPHHIQPEWYFLFAYAILRSIPNKLGGVIALAMAVLILYSLPSTHLSVKKSTMFYPANKTLFWLLVTNLVLLTWIGARPVEEPYMLTGQILTTTYFLYYLVNPLMMKAWDMINKS